MSERSSLSDKELQPLWGRKQLLASMYYSTVLRSAVWTVFPWFYFSRCNKLENELRTSTKHVRVDLSLFHAFQNVGTFFPSSIWKVGYEVLQTNKGEAVGRALSPVSSETDRDLRSACRCVAWFFIFYFSPNEIKKMPLLILYVTSMENYKILNNCRKIDYDWPEKAFRPESTPFDPDHLLIAAAAVMHHNVMNR